MPNSVVTIARDIATEAHAGQVDKSGEPYIGHPARVAARLEGDDQAQAAAWLHDVLEDTSVTAADLAARGMPEDVVIAVTALTRSEGEQPDDYYARVAAVPLALKVKRADIADNRDPQRVAALDPLTRERLTTKYAHAVAELDRNEAVSSQRAATDSPVASPAE